MNTRPFVTRTVDVIESYRIPENAPSLIDADAQGVTRYNLFETPAPAHTKNYMLGLDVLGWTTESGTERSQLVINQKAGALVVPWEPNQDGDGIWVYLQEAYRGPHAKNESQVKNLIDNGQFDQLGIWSLEAPAGGLNYDNGAPVERPAEAAIREVREETGIHITEDSLVELIPGGLQISGDVNTKRSYLFAADISVSKYEASSQAIETDENIGNLIAFCVRSLADVRTLTGYTRLDAGTTPALALLALQPDVLKLLSTE